MDDNLQNNIKRWVELDNNIKSYNDTLKSLRLERSQLSTDINTYLHDNSLENHSINITDGVLKCVDIKHQQALSMTYIRSILEKCIIHDNRLIELIMSELKSSREYKIQKDIKRSYNK